MPVQERSLQDLISVGPAMLRDFEMLGIRSVKQLARQDPVKLYRKLCRITGQHVDICCQDVFTAAVAQARGPQHARRAGVEVRNPLLPAEQCQWWYWSRQRKAGHARS
ncbi:MAG TPA: helix-hairpin-helix domain-containing protein [Candidatus Angelobacter sp.]|nr:helix-hairpin-helix domain-containing protein [Candidatus Angelobacter sp.]